MMGNTASSRRFLGQILRGGPERLGGLILVSRLVAMFSRELGKAPCGSRAIWTLLPAVPAGFAMRPPIAGFGSRCRVDSGGKIGLYWVAG